MALVSGGRSTLNPDAPLYIPAAYRQVEDFSPEWWQLVTTSTWYRDYWLSEHPNGVFDDAQDDLDCNDVIDMLPDTFDLDVGEDFPSMEDQLEEFIQFSEAEGNGFSYSPVTNATAGKGMQADATKNLDLLKSLDQGDAHPKKEAARYAEKPTKNMSPKCSPRFIHQPR